MRGERRGYEKEKNMLNQLNMAGLDKVEVSIKRLKLFEPEGGVLSRVQRRKRQCSD